MTIGLQQCLRLTAACSVLPIYREDAVFMKISQGQTIREEELKSSQAGCCPDLLRVVEVNGMNRFSLVHCLSLTIVDVGLRTKLLLVYSWGPPDQPRPPGAIKRTFQMADSQAGRGVESTDSPSWQKIEQCGKGGDGLAWRLFCCGLCRGLPRKNKTSQKRQMREEAGGCLLSDPQDIEVQVCKSIVTSLDLHRGPEAEKRPLSEGPSADGRRSSSSLETMPLKLRKTPLSSLSLQKCVVQPPKAGDPSKEAEACSLTINLTPGAQLLPPAIHLIPPTPSVGIDNDQFFEINSDEESVSTEATATADLESSVIQTDSSSGGVIGSYDEIHTSLMHSGAWASAGEHVSKVRKDLSSDQTSHQHGEQHIMDPRTEPWAETEKASQVNVIFGNYQVAPLPQHQRKNDINNKEINSRELIKADLRLMPFQTKLDSLLRVKRPAARTCSLGDMAAVAGELQSERLVMYTGTEENESPRQRRITIGQQSPNAGQACHIRPVFYQFSFMVLSSWGSSASYMPGSADADGNLKERGDGREAHDRALQEMNTDEVCEWLANLGLQKSVPLIKEASLQGQQLASIDLDTLEFLQLSTAEEKENLLSSIYNNLHPTDNASQYLDRLFETIGPYDIERFTAALVPLSAFQASGQCPDWVTHQSRYVQNREDLPLKEKTAKRSYLVNLYIKAFQQKVHLKVAKDMTIGKVIDACIKILGLNESADLLSLNIVSSRTGGDEVLHIFR
eukprot:gi/632974471/ref/XP_007903696.1/ PREDICTED: uncharacterized protein LOC103186456 [Callorhinchus milii]